MNAPVILRTRGLSKEFRGFHAVRNVSLEIRRNTIHALIGPNGAGKTTCFNLLTRFIDATAGTIRYDGQDITRTPADAVARRGLVRSFQISAVFGKLSVFENVRLARAAQPGPFNGLLAQRPRAAPCTTHGPASCSDEAGLSEWAGHLAGESALRPQARAGAGHHAGAGAARDFAGRAHGRHGP
jgi:branched-chain amino acid transport system ATP-binding protein